MPTLVGAGRAGVPTDVQALIAQLGLPLFVKQASQGASMGVSKVKQASVCGEVVVHAADRALV